MRHSRSSSFQPILGAIVLAFCLHLSPGSSANNDPGEVEPGQADDRRRGNDRSIGHVDDSPYEMAADFFSTFLQTGDWAYAANRANDEAFQRTEDFNRTRDLLRLRLISMRKDAMPTTSAQETHIRNTLETKLAWPVGQQLNWAPVSFGMPPAAANFAAEAMAQDDATGDDLINIFRVQRSF